LALAHASRRLASQLGLPQIRSRPDHWVAGGALAISALAAGKVTEAAGALGQFSEQHQVLTTSTLVLWCLAVVWLFPLVTGEVLRPRLSYDVRRWATVFPLGIYTACSLATGQVTGITGITGFGQVWSWIAFTVQPARARRAVPSWLAGAAWSAPPRRCTGRGVDRVGPGASTPTGADNAAC